MTTSFLFVIMMFPATLIVSCYFVLGMRNYILETKENFDRKFLRATRLLEGQEISTFSLHRAKGTAINNKCMTLIIITFGYSYWENYSSSQKIIVFFLWTFKLFGFYCRTLLLPSRRSFMSNLSWLINTPNYLYEYKI